MNYNRYQNCLRLQITVDDASEERISDLVRHCKEYGFDNVMLMLNTEEFNVGHITIEEAKPWGELFRHAATGAARSSPDRISRSSPISTDAKAQWSPARCVKTGGHTISNW